MDLPHILVRVVWALFFGVIIWRLFFKKRPMITQGPEERRPDAADEQRN